MAQNQTPEKDETQSGASLPHDATNPAASLGPQHASLLPIVGIGASAGGLDAFKKFLSNMPTDTGVAFVLLPHLDPTHESLMVELLARQTAMHVCEARHEMQVEPNCVYIIPPNKYLAVDEGKLQLSEPSERHGIPTAIDFFFRSLAYDQSERAIAIILSGTSNHGTVGIKAIKQAGGMVMAQQPESAEYDQMPRNAIATGLVDYVLPPEEMPEALVKYLQQPYVRGTNDPVELSDTPEQLDGILALLRTHTQYDFSSYRKNMLMRRVLRRMGLFQIARISEYVDKLRSNPTEISALYNDLLIGVTEFFRDPEAFKLLQQRVINEIVATANQQSNLTDENPLAPVAARKIRVWVPACATGEEAYTIAILLLESIAQQNKAVEFQIFATDIDQRSLESARQGIYSESNVGGVSAQRLQQFFTKLDSNHWQVNKSLREAITFAPHNLICDAPFSKIDFISCRNLLIYLEPDAQEKMLRLFHYALNVGGYLLLGPSESIGRKTELFEPISKKWRIYQRLGDASRSFVKLPIVSTGPRRSLRSDQHKSHALPAIRFKDILQRLILETYAPAAVLITRQHEIVSVIGPVVKYLDFPPGEITHDLLALARPGLRATIRAAVLEVIRTGEMVSVLDAHVKRDGDYRSCIITVQPVSNAKSVSELLLVVFRDHDGRVDSHATPLPTQPSEQAQLLQLLEFELKTSREDLQSTIDEYRGSTEELKVANEEVLSMNEELQSSNEELESAKEELQSLNEELSTVNSQLQDKVEEVERANSDLMNLITSSNVATIFLDANLLIKRFTPSIAQLLSLRDTDLGRPFDHFAPKFNDSALLEDCRMVLQNHAPIEREVWAQLESPTTRNDSLATESLSEALATPQQDSTVSPFEPVNARCYLRRVLPYRSNEQRVIGLCISFIDISERIAVEAQSRYLAHVLRDSNDAITVQQFDGRIIAWNRGAEMIYGYSEAEALQRKLPEMIPAGRQMEFSALIERVRRNEVIKSFETQRIAKDGRVLDIEMTLTAVRNERGQPISIATTERDITQRKLVEQARFNQEALARSILDSLTAHVAVLDRQGNIVRVNQAWERFAHENGATELARVGVGANYLEECQRAAQDGNQIAAQAHQGLQALLNLQLSEFTVEYPCHSGKQKRWFLLSATPILGGQGGAVVSHLPITDRKQTEELIKDREERMRTILNTASDAIITIDQSGVIVDVNPATERMFGYPREQLIGQNVNILMPSPYHEEHDGYLRRFLQTGEPRIIGRGREAIALRKDRSTFPIDLAVSQVDHMGLFTGIIRDISDRKELQKQVLESAAEEDRRIGHELHDNVQQQLTGLGLLAKSLADSLAKQSISESTKANRLAKGISALTEIVHLLSRGLMPVEVDSQGLQAALNDLAENTQENYDVECEFLCTQSITISDNFIATHLYRITQEAITNAIKHGLATCIQISLSRINQIISLVVVDNGVGIGNITPDSAGKGLKIMRYRAGLMGANVDFQPNPQGGTVVTCTLHQGKGLS